MAVYHMVTPSTFSPLPLMKLGTESQHGNNMTVDQPHPKTLTLQSSTESPDHRPLQPPRLPHKVPLLGVTLY